MNSRRFALYVCAAALLAGASGCSDRGKARLADAGVRKTGFPGQVTAGGGTSGEVLARAGAARDSSYAGGTPGIAGGSGGTTGGTATAGTVEESGHGPSGNTAPPAARTTPSGQ
jgi:hypothetical protein